MRFKMMLSKWSEVQKSELEEAGVNVTPATIDDEEECMVEYFVEIKSLEQAVELTQKFGADLVITKEPGEAFFFNGYYEG